VGKRLDTAGTLGFSFSMSLAHTVRPVPRCHSLTLSAPSVPLSDEIHLVLGAGKVRTD
jgi:hypothetical protein